jgi:RNA polymerase sigma-70 factor (ECF subfamily)
VTWPWPTADRRATHLLRRAREGNRDAFRAAYRELYPRVAAYAARRCRRREDAEDLVARTFHKLLERLQSFDDAKGEALPFVLSIARNLLIDDARARRPGVDLDEVSESAAGLIEQRTPLHALLKDEELRELKSRLDALPAATRELLSLRYGDGLTHRQIAALLGLSEDAVKQRVSRTVRELRATLEPSRKGALA